MNDQRSDFERLREVASKIGITGNSALARFLDEAPQTITNWQARGIPARKIFPVARKLGVSPEWLATGHGDDSAVSHGLDNMKAALDMLEVAANRMPPCEKGLLSALLEHLVSNESSTARKAAKKAILTLLETKS